MLERIDERRLCGPGIGYQAAWLVALIAVAARIFASDRLLTMKLALRRKRA